jgi:hypothetical protein
MNLASTQPPEPFNASITQFQPQNEHEEITARVVRLQLNFEVLRVQLESNLVALSETERMAMRRHATNIRVAGFRLQREASESGKHFAYDDELLRREGTRIAYLLARNAKDQAALIEEEVVTMSVHKALYAIDEEMINIAEAA